MGGPQTVVEGELVVAIVIPAVLVGQKGTGANLLLMLLPVEAY
jgi:hypothetical protein